MLLILCVCDISVFQFNVFLMLLISDKVRRYILDQCTDVSLDKDTLIKTYCFTDGEIT